MSKALRCDRCGGYYRPDEEARETMFIPRITWRNAESVKDVRVTRSLEELDLCAKCTDAFDLFMKGFTLKKKEEDAE